MAFQQMIPSAGRRFRRKWLTYSTKHALFVHEWGGSLMSGDVERDKCNFYMNYNLASAVPHCTVLLYYSLYTERRCGEGSKTDMLQGQRRNCCTTFLGGGRSRLSFPKKTCTIHVHTCECLCCTVCIVDTVLSNVPQRCMYHQHITYSGASTKQCRRLLCVHQRPRLRIYRDHFAGLSVCMRS